MEKTGEYFTAVYQAEEALIGSILIDPDWISQVKEIVKPNYFHNGTHKKIFTAMIECDHPDQIMTAQKMIDQGTLEAGVIAQMSGMIATTPTSLDCMYYAEAVRNYAAQRYVDYYTGKGEMEKAQQVLDRIMQPKIKGGIKEY